MIIDFSKYSTIKVGAKIDVQVIDEDNFYDGFLIGKASNTLISPEAKNLTILDDKYKFITIENGYLKVGAKTKNSQIFNFCKKNDIKGFEFLGKLPGTIGGTIKMNGGMKEYEISQNLVAIKSLTGWIEKKDIMFDYRFSNINYPIFEAIFEIKNGFDFELLEIFTKMRLNQPNNPSLGSVFKNPKDNYAGKLIQDVGLKGFKKGSMQWSEIHANFLVNLGGGSFEDSIFLIKLAEKKVFEEFGINLQKEIKIVY
jgi:UDP-N-acetylmuramate dehydrogenase